MRLDADAVRRRCEARGLPLARVLREAGVSRTAYYSLLRRESVLPKSVLKLASTLGTAPSEILDERALEERRARRRLQEARRIVKKNPRLDFQDVWHSLVRLELPPAERLRRALRRVRARAV